MVPRLIRFSGELTPPVSQSSQAREQESGQSSARAAVVAVFSLYEFREGGSPVWSEMQKVQLDDHGRYTVLLGATEAAGLPLDVFTSGKALWLGIQWPGAPEQPRVLLVAVPYALKAADSDTLGGKPASAYALAGPAVTAVNGAVGPLAASGAGDFSSGSSRPGNQTTAEGVGRISTPRPADACSSTTGDGAAAVPQVALYSGSCTLTEDPNFVDVSGQVGIGTSNPNSPLNVVGTFGSAAANQNAVNVTTNWTPTATASSYIVVAGNFLATKLGAYNATNGIARVRAMQGLAYNEGSGSVSGMAALTGGVQNVGSGTVTAGIGLDIFSPVAAVASPIVNSYGVYINGQTGTGVTNGYGVYSAGASDISFFNGSVGIGTTTPAGKLEVNGTAKFDQAVTFPAGQTFTGNGSGLTALNASNLSSGTVPSAVLSGTYSNAVSFTNAANSFTGSGSGLTGVNAATLSGNLASAFQRAGSYANSTNDNLSNQSDGVGALALANLTSGGQNVGIGSLALNQNTTGNYNNAIGTVALFSNTSGYKNNAMGWQALTSNTTGIHNTAVGHESLQGLSSGNDNTALGYRAGYGLSTGNNNTFIGSAANPGVDGLSNATAIGFEAQVNQNNSLVLGSTAAQNSSANTHVGIDMGTPSNILTVLQGGGHAIADGWDTYSSRRWKSNIHTLDGALGKVEQLRGVEYTYAASGHRDIGMIAEEVGKVVPEVVSYEENGKDARGIDYARLTALLVEAVKQQQAEIRRQQSQLSKQQLQVKKQQVEARQQQAEIRRLRSKVEAIEGTKGQ